MYRRYSINLMVYIGENYSDGNVETFYMICCVEKLRFVPGVTLKTWYTNLLKTTGILQDPYSVHFGSPRGVYKSKYNTF